eukprot:CAMPEP_0205920194 /NCGR_PEP_ID=MMETSP1325-20131115/10922_1 /ASSEMBLY_ACC=CAM_ASM_000708 /TAXON_ID=236786 /ORGANISM="Florenciella sp., Strain RCC1007" /LENGTH=51 /DNA_ID=CAMNT_0053287865 /DNA_START=52 /DNA_END=204 /DNA_ORIENTATION=+
MRYPARTAGPLLSSAGGWLGRGRNTEKQKGAAWRWNATAAAWMSDGSRTST